MRSKRVGLIGTGFSARSHVEALRRVPEVEVVAIAGSNPAKSRSAAASLHIPSARSVDQMLGAEDVDAIHNCTPNHLHAPLNTAALGAGKHVLSEKPLGLDSAETAAQVEALRAAGVVGGVCFNYRHYPLVGQARAMLAAGQCGTPHFVHGSYLQDWLLYETDWNWRLEPERGGASRAVADIGSHWLDLAQHVLGQRVVSVLADLATLHETRLRPAAEEHTFSASGEDVAQAAQAAQAAQGERHSVATEDFGAVLARFDGGCRATFSVSQVSPGCKNRLRLQVDASEASLAWDQEEPNRLWVGRRNEANRELLRDPGLLAPAAAPLAHYPAGHPEGWPDGLKNLFIDFYAAIESRGGGEPHTPSFATFEDAHHVACAVEAMVASNRTGSWTRVDSEGAR